MIYVHVENSGRLVIAPDEGGNYTGNIPVAALVHSATNWYCQGWEGMTLEDDSKVCTLPELVEALKAIQDSKR